MFSVFNALLDAGTTSAITPCIIKPHVPNQSNSITVLGKFKRCGVIIRFSNLPLHAKILL